MAHPGAESGAWLRRGPAVAERLTGVAVLALLGVVVLGGAMGSADPFDAWQIAVAVLLLVGVLIVARSLFADELGFEPAEPYRVALQLGLLAVLLVVAYRSRTPGFVLGVHRPAETAFVFLALVAFCVLARDPRRYSPLQWVVIGCLATVLGIFFYHSVSIAEVSFRSRHPVWAGFVMAVGLVVLPQYVPREGFLWAVSRLAALLVVVSLPMYVLGEYAAFGLQFSFHRSYTVPVVGYEVRATRSLFASRNILATVLFAGVVAAVAEVHRRYVRERPAWSVAVSVVLLAVNAVGLALSFGRALWVITPMALGVYVAYLAFGRRAVPVSVLAGFLYLVAGIVAVHAGYVPLPEDTPTRATRWYPAVRAILEEPSLLGAGLVDPGQITAPYHPWGSTGSPHNSYLMMGIRAGILGGLAYFLLVVASLCYGVRDRTGDVAVLALAVGFAAHQQFEAYTLFNWGTTTVLAVLAFGFLVFGGQERPSPAPIGD